MIKLNEYCLSDLCISNVRYSNSKLMHVGHQYVASNIDPSTLKGLVSVDAYHIFPDNGLGIFTFDN